MRFKQHLNILFCLLPFFLVACSAGMSSTSTTSSTNYSGPDQNLGSYIFNESNITMTLGSTEEVVLSRVHGTAIIPGPVTFYIFESGIVTLTPDYCYLDYSESTPSCMININAIGIGTTKIAANGPGLPLYVTVTN